MKVGVFSGTFDPIHEGHILFAQTAISQFGLDKVVFLLESNPRRKENVQQAQHRRKMIELAIKDYPELAYFDSKIEQHNLLDTLEELVQNFEGASFALIMGADLFETVESWPNFEELAKDLAFIVALRTEDDGEIVIPMAKKLGLEVEFLPSPLASVSSNKIRNEITRGDQPIGLNEDVEDYIRSNSLYTS